MFATDDSIVAIATPPGRGGIGVIRVSGPRAEAIAGALLDRRSSLVPRVATFARVRRQDGGAVGDEVVATYFPGPHSYTGEDVLEISAHGSPVILQSVVRQAIDAGARLAEPGEFTFRAFLNGKRDLVSAEAVADLIEAATPLQARVAFDQLQGTLTTRIAAVDATLFDLIARLEASLDFPDEGYHFIAPAKVAGAVSDVVREVDLLLADGARGRMIREGATVVIAGRTNVGKSSIFNKLTGAERAIVTPIAGTTRDLVSERVDIEGLAVTLVDTAGWRETSDIVEREGVARGEQARRVADLTLVVLDQSEPLTRDDDEILAATSRRPRILVGNKSDAVMGRGVSGRPAEADNAHPAAAVAVSAKTGCGMDDLRRAIAQALTGDELLRDTAVVSNSRHIALLEQARASLVAAQQAASAGDTPEEFVLTDLQAARARLEEIVGVRTSEDVLRHIFERFCIGK